MSHDGLDEETKRLLAEVEKTDDSKSEIKKDKQEKSDVKEDDYNWETNTLEDPDSEW